MDPPETWTHLEHWTHHRHGFTWKLNQPETWTHLEHGKVEGPDDGEYDAVPLVARNDGNERQDGASEAQEVHAGLDVQTDLRKESQKSRLICDKILKRLSFCDPNIGK